MKTLISFDQVVARTVLQPNVDAQKVELAIKVVQPMYLKKLLGAALYNELLLAAQAEPLEDEKLAALLNSDELQNMLAQWVVVQAWPDLLVHLTNAGVVLKTGKDTSTSADAKLVESTLAAHTRTADFYTNELRAWLYEHRADYPSYQPAGARVPAETMPLGGLNQ